MPLHRLAVACSYVRSGRLPDSNISAAEAACRLEAEVRKVQGKLANLLRQIDRNLIPHIASLQALALAEASHEPSRNEQAAAIAAVDNSKISLEQRFSQFKKSEDQSTPVDKGKFYAKLYGEGWSKKQIAEIAGYSQRYVSILIILPDLPFDIQAIIDNKEISPTCAYENWQKADYDDEETVRILSRALKLAKNSGKNKVTEQIIETALRR